MAYKFARGINLNRPTSEFTDVEWMYRKVQDLAADFVACQKGYGPTHERTYREAAKKVIEMIRDGEYVIAPTQLELWAQ